MKIKRFSTLGDLTDFDDTLARRWSDSISSRLDAEVATLLSAHPGIQPQFYNPSKLHVSGSAVPISWPAFPNIVGLNFGDDTRRMFEKGDERDNQDEYLEWSVVKQNDKITRVMFTCEGPEYWDFIAQNDPNLLVRLYSTIVGQPVPRRDLLAANGTYRRRNRWNLEHAVHLVQPSNTLGAEIRTPREDHPELAKNPDVNNDFLFSEATPEVMLADGTIAGATLPPAEADPQGAICPFPAHIRKVNPRDDPTETIGLRRTRTRLMLRRGIPYGPAPSVPMPVEDDGIDRGLLFMAYQASIVEQFEFVTKTWVNRDNSPHNSIPTTGHDPIIGQSTRQRFIRCVLDDQLIDLPEPWVVTTGGGYFFTPAVSAIKGVLSDL